MPTESKSVTVVYEGLFLDVEGKYTWDKDDSTFELVNVMLEDNGLNINVLVEGTSHWHLLEELVREQLDQEHGPAPEFPGFKRGE